VVSHRLRGIRALAEEARGDTMKTTDIMAKSETGCCPKCAKGYWWRFEYRSKWRI